VTAARFSGTPLRRGAAGRQPRGRCVIGRFETVDVDEGEDESPIRAAGPVNLSLQIDHAAVTLKRSGQAVNACLPAVAGSLPPIVRGPLTKAFTDSCEVL
jgi:hypothetical protein